MRRLTVLFALLVSVATPVVAQVTPAVWSSVKNGSLAGVSFTTTGFSSFFGLSSASFLDVDYGANPLTNVTALQYGWQDNWTVSFASPITNLRLYAQSWRGIYFSTGNGPTTYTLSQPFTILSGFTGISPFGNVFSLPGNAFFNGVIEFSGAVSSISVTSDGTNVGGQLLTFALTVPEPESAVLFAIGLVGLTLLARHRCLAFGRSRS